uniref:Transmembrane serine protease 9 n=1 Tax=Cebus imitator TaxID=2715852 RepID=A0A2K5QFL0_CEBIM
MESTVADVHLVPRATKEVPAPDAACCRAATVGVVATSLVVLTLGVVLAFLSMQGVHVDHTAQLWGIRWASSLRQEASDYHRTLTPTLEALLHFLLRPLQTLSLGREEELLQEGIRARLQKHGISLAAYGTIVSAELTGRHKGPLAERDLKSGRCPGNSFSCHNGQCVTKLNPECDDQQDCSDGSDEALCECGLQPAWRTAGRIVGGVEASPGEFPWQASLREKKEHFCGATVIGARWLVSAAHCFNEFQDPTEWVVYVGTTHLSGSEASTVRARVAQIIKHPLYNADTADFDVAVLELTSPLAFGRHIQPVCLPAATHVFPPSKKCLISGWGYLKEDFQCGARPAMEKPPRIVGGFAADSGEVPWQVSLKEGARHFCGATVVGDRWLLSAAHCFNHTKVEQVRAHLGTASLLGLGGSPAKVGLRRVVLHPLYNPGILDFDLAVLELASPLAFNKYIQPVCLPLAIQKFPVGRKCMISGWGNTQEGNGDSGGPLACEETPGVFYLAGIVSWGIGCAQVKKPGVYTRITRLKGWILETMASQPLPVSPPLTTRTLATTSHPPRTTAGLTVLGPTPSQPTPVATSRVTGQPANSTLSAVSITSGGQTPLPDSPEATTRYQLPDCGLTPAALTRIVGGSAAGRGEWPWQVSLWLRRREHRCGAVLVAERWLLSAAHCFDVYGDPKQWAAFLGTPFLSGAEGQLERVAHIYKHPFYNLYTLDYDVALLELAGPVRRSRLVRPICLPEPAPRPPDGARCVITGWGSVREGGSMARQLQKAAVRLLSEQTCRRFYPVQISSRMLCAGFPQGGVDSCSGDAGGPLACREPSGRWVLTGVTSWGYGCGRPHFPGVYTRVAAVRGWIGQHIQE